MDKGKMFYLNDLYILRPSKVKMVDGDFVTIMADDGSMSIPGVRQTITFETIPNQIVLAHKMGSVSDYHYVSVFETSDGTIYPYFTHSHFYGSEKLAREGLKVNEKAFGYVDIVPDDIISLSSLDDLRFINRFENGSLFEKVKYFDNPFSKNRSLKEEYHIDMDLRNYSLGELSLIRDELKSLISAYGSLKTVREFTVVKEPNKSIMMDGILIGSRSAYAGTSEDTEYQLDKAIRKSIK